MDQRQALKPRALLLSIDRLLERLYPTRTETQPAPEAVALVLRPTTALGWTLVAVTLGTALAVNLWLR